MDKRKMIGDYIFVSKYAQTHNHKKETWEESVARVMEMNYQHLTTDYPQAIDNAKFMDYFNEAWSMYLDQNVLGSQRALQFGGNNMLVHNTKCYNCCGTYINRLSVFKELMYLLLSGCGVGYSVQKKHIDQLPKLKGVDQSKEKVHVIGDSIEGWAEAVDVLISAHWNGEALPIFDYSRIRPKGSLTSSGFIAPGPDPLHKSLDKIHNLLKQIKGRRATPFELHRVCCTIADAVIAGGVRRAALICQFDADDKELLNCKTGNWYSEYPELARANNSAMILPDTPKEVYDGIFQYVKEYGEPGIIFSIDRDILFNPCCEVSGYPQVEVDGKTEYGFFFCNLTEINGAKVKTEEDFYRACRAAAILGTIQASYTNFRVLSSASRLIAERDALIGVGITGMCEHPNILFNPEIQRKGAEIVRQTNREVAEMIGIQPAARCTVIKPSGNSSQLLGCTSSGIHRFPFKRFFRFIQAANTEQAFQEIKKVNPYMVQPSAYNPEIESVISFPIELPDGVLTLEGCSAIKFLETVKLTKQNWIEAGTNLDHPFYKMYPQFQKMRMNVSNTCSVAEGEWEEVKEWVWQNREELSGISFLPRGGDLIYPQAPYTSVLDEKELSERYGAGAILAGGLIVDGLAAFNDNLWLACDAAMGRNDKQLTLTDKEIAAFICEHIKDGKFLVDIGGIMISDVNAVIAHLNSVVEKKRDWVRRFKKFARKYMNDNLQKTELCLKHVSLFHRWQKLKDIREVDWSSVHWQEQRKKAGEDIASACVGGKCEL